MRVIAGALGGRRLIAPKGRETRPTSDRVREAMFSSLGDVTGVVVLDLYAGSGALGIEALSRGAASAVFVEHARPALAALRQNLKSLALDARAEVLAVPVSRAIPSLGGRGFGLVLADPPYAQLAEAARELDVLVRLAGAVSSGARLVLEHAARDAPPSIAGIVPNTTRKYGDTAVSRYVVAPPSGPVPDCGG